MQVIGNKDWHSKKCIRTLKDILDEQADRSRSRINMITSEKEEGEEGEGKSEAIGPFCSVKWDSIVSSHWIQNMRCLNTVTHLIMVFFF